MNFSIASSDSTDFLNLPILRNDWKLKEGRRKERDRRRRNIEERKYELEREEKTYRSKEKLLGQAFYAEKRRRFGWTLGRIQGMCARTLECKSKETDWFKWVFIPLIKITTLIFPPIKAKEIPTIGLPSHRLMWRAQSHQNLMRMRLVYQSTRSVP